MKVILVKDLKRKGTFGDTIDVADGYARNYLIPNGYALVFNKTNQKRFEEIKEKALINVQEHRQVLQETVKQIKGKSFSMTALSRDGKLYGSVTPSIIVTTIKQEMPDLQINANDIIIEDGSIKYTGSYACKAQFTRDISASFTLVVESDETHEQPELLEAILETPVKKETNDTEVESTEDDDTIALDDTENATSEDALAVDESQQPTNESDSDEASESIDS